MKKVLLVVIDALSSTVVRPAVEQGKLPTLRKLIEAGQVNWDCTSVFPSITPAATASITTGQYPSDHNVLGAYYYDREKDEVRFFGADIWVIWNRRFHDYMEDFVEKLNDQCLSAPTIFQQLEDQSRSCASINYLIFAASHQHKVHTPWLLRLWPGMPHHRIAGAKHQFVVEMRDGVNGELNLDRKKPTAVYCGSGYRASIAASLLQREGFDEVYNVPGSLQAWKNQGYEIEE